MIQINYLSKLLLLGLCYLFFSSEIIAAKQNNWDKEEAALIKKIEKLEREVKISTAKKTQFSIKRICTISTITNYLYTDGQETVIGTIGLRSSKGKMYGPWQVNAKNALGKDDTNCWIVTPRISIPPRRYTIIDSNKETWSSNSQSRNRGMTQVFGNCKKTTKEKDNL